MSDTPAKGNMMNNKEEIKLLIDHALLEQEQRISKEMRAELETQTARLTDAIDKQNKMYSDSIISLNRELGSLQTKVAGFKAVAITVGAACGTLGGLVGFFVAQLTRN